MTFVMVFLDACDDILDRVAEQATYASVLVICIRMTFFLPFLPLEKCCTCGGGT